MSLLILNFYLNFSFAACTFYSKNGPDAEADGARFIRVREDMPVGGEILNLRAYPRTNVVIKGTERSSDKKYFKLREVNDTNIQVLLDKSIDDLVDRDVPQNVLKFKIECSNRKSRQDEVIGINIIFKFKLKFCLYLKLFVFTSADKFLINYSLYRRHKRPHSEIFKFAIHRVY